MPEEVKESVAEEAEEGREAPSEDQGAQDEESLESLLGEWDQDSGSEQPKPEEKDKPEDDDRMSKLEGEIRDLRRRDAEKAFNESVQTAVKTVQNVIGDGAYDNSEVEDFLWARAARDQRFQNAFLNRGVNPSAFDKVLKALGKELGQRAKNRPDPQTTSDSEAVAAAVRGSSNRAPDTEEDFSKVEKMSDVEFETWVQQQGKKKSA